MISSNNTAESLSQRLREVFLNGKWIANTNYREELTASSFVVAIQSLSGCNSIAQLSYHILYYLRGLNKVLEGGPLEISDKYSFELPELHSETDWQELIAALMSQAEKFAGLVSELTDAQLQSPFAAPQYGTYQKNIEAVLEHSYYHLGQIVLIRKLIERA